MVGSRGRVVVAPVWPPGRSAGARIDLPPAGKALGANYREKDHRVLEKLKEPESP